MEEWGNRLEPMTIGEFEVREVGWWPEIAGAFGTALAKATKKTGPQP